MIFSQFRKVFSGPFLSGFAAVVLIAGLGMTVYLSQQQQDQRSKAAELTVI